MRNPVRSEADAFRFVLLTVGYFALIVIGSVINVWLGRGGVRRAHRRRPSGGCSPPRRAPSRPSSRRPRRARPSSTGSSSSRTRRSAAPCSSTRSAPRADGERDARVLVVCPALNSPLRHWASDEDGARHAAQARLDASLAPMRSAGIDAAGEVGDGDPIQAIEDALRTFRPGRADRLDASAGPVALARARRRRAGARAVRAARHPRHRRPLLTRLDRAGRPAAAPDGAARGAPGRARGGRALRRVGAGASAAARARAPTSSSSSHATRTSWSGFGYGYTGAYGQWWTDHVARGLTAAQRPSGSTRRTSRSSSCTSGRRTSGAGSARGSSRSSSRGSRTTARSSRRSAARARRAASTRRTAGRARRGRLRAGLPALHRARQARAASRRYLPALLETNAATASICACVSWPLNAGIAPPPFSTWCATVACDGFSWSRFGPTFPVDPAAFSVWQPPQPAEAKTALPSGFAAAVVVVVAAARRRRRGGLGRHTAVRVGRALRDVDARRRRRPGRGRGSPASASPGRRSGRARCRASSAARSPAPCRTRTRRRGSGRPCRSTSRRRACGTPRTSPCSCLRNSSLPCAASPCVTRPTAPQPAAASATSRREAAVARSGAGRYELG